MHHDVVSGSRIIAGNHSYSEEEEILSPRVALNRIGSEE